MNLSDLKLPVLVVVSLLGAAAGAGSNVALTSAKINAAVAKNREQDTQIAELNKQREELKERVIKIEVNTEIVVKSLERIERAMGTK